MDTVIINRTSTMNAEIDVRIVPTVRLIVGLNNVPEIHGKIRNIILALRMPGPG